MCSFKRRDEFRYSKLLYNNNTLHHHVKCSRKHFGIDLLLFLLLLLDFKLDSLHLIANSCHEKKQSFYSQHYHCFTKVHIQYFNSYESHLWKAFLKYLNVRSTRYCVALIHFFIGNTQSQDRSLKCNIPFSPLHHTSSAGSWVRFSSAAALSLSVWFRALIGCRKCHTFWHWTSFCHCILSLRM